MKKIINKDKLLGFILGLLVCGGIVFAVNYTAADIEYKDNKNVQQAIDELKEKAKPAYTGDTTVTPSSSEQTLSTKDKILLNNIKINAIPSTYKNLTANTTVSSNNLLSGKTAYDNLGNLITGTYTDSCISGNFVCGSGCAGTGGQVIIDFNPTVFWLYGSVIHNVIYHNKDNSNTIWALSPNANWTDASATVYISNNKLYAKNWNNAYNVSFPFVACR